MYIDIADLLFTLHPIRPPVMNRLFVIALLGALGMYTPPFSHISRAY
jgi:hypothetical protein